MDSSDNTPETDSSGLTHAENYGASTPRFILPVAAIGLVITFGLFWLIQLFGQWYVRMQLADLTHSMVEPVQELALRKVGFPRFAEGLVANPASDEAMLIKLFTPPCEQAAFFSCVLLQGDKPVFLGRTPKNIEWPKNRDDWNTLALGAEWLNQDVALLPDTSGKKPGAGILIFGSKPFTRKAPLTGIHVLGLLDTGAMLNEMKSLMSLGDIDQIELFTTPKHRRLAFVEAYEESEVGFFPLIRGDTDWRLGNLLLTLRYGASPQKFLLWVIVLPYVALALGLLLISLVIFHFWRAWQREQEVHGLAQSLTKTVGELEQRIVEGELMSAALRESERKYRAIFENASIGICQISSRNEWINANRTLATLLGYHDVVELLAGQPDFHGRLFLEPAARAEWIRGMLDQGLVRDFEAALIRRDGEVIWVSINSHAVRSDSGHLLHFEATFSDITERRRTQRALISAKEQADYANRSKSEFLANMSHELRTPLNAIIGFSEIIKDELFGKVATPQYVEYAKDIYDSGELLLTLINDILDMSKIEAGKRDLSESVINVNRVLQACLRLVAARAKASKQKLDIHLPRDFPDLRGEEKAVKQILVNLLTNAIKFTPEGGEITVQGHISGAGEMVLSVVDTGIGIAKEHIPVVLAPFGQIESSLSRKNQGTGLGLPLTKALVELHEGTLTIDSAVGVGTTVTVTFPASRVLQQVL
ncbi:MAG: PAS domain S-box protein [Proteobacteria bacterium]|nr:PAS domain S-box protein [Pseudomonadota bacterium]